MISLKISVVPTKFFTVSFSTIHGNSLQSLFEYGRIMNSYRMKIKFEKVLDLLLTEKGEGILNGDESAESVCDTGFDKREAHPRNHPFCDPAADREFGSAAL